MNIASMIAVAAVTAGSLPLAAEAGTLTEQGRVGTQSAPSIQAATSTTSGQLSGVTTETRRCSDFLNRQGISSRFFPPVKDYVGWTDAAVGEPPSPTTFGLVDYAGLAAKYIKSQTEESLGTEVQCSLTEGTLADGSANIKVTLVTTKALGFAQSIEDLSANKFNFRKTPTIFGAKAQDVVGGADPALGSATLDVSFHIEKPGGLLPDLVDVLVNKPCRYAPVEFRFGSLTEGERPDNTKVLRISQAGSTDLPCTGLVFSEEVVKIIP